jgi:hypothetical protein
MSKSDNPVQIAVGRLAAALRQDREQDPARIADARNELVAARLEREVMKAVRPTDPDYEPLRPDDRERLAHLLLHG